MALCFRMMIFLQADVFQPKSGSWRFGIGVEVACGMVDGIKSLV
jgi:hypothetical protein